jgi:4-hydroxythreonine-4-phosphate dehydrogenase
MPISLPRLLITPGEPAGIGPDIILQIAQQHWQAELVAVADPDLLQARAKQLNVSLQLVACDIHAAPQPHLPGTLKILPVSLHVAAQAGKLNAQNAPYVLHTLELAATHCLEQRATAMVTGPVHKSIINQAGIHFSGHTEFLADYCSIEQTVMLFVTDQLKVALATTHLPLAQVPTAITRTGLRLTLSILQHDLRHRFGIVIPRILVCGLNPHAGEGGYLGREEMDIIAPALAALHHPDCTITGPLPADTIFTPKYLQNTDAILAMYHDQALPLIKYLGFGQAINVTLGLPFIRTSVDHGTALDIAGKHLADSGSMAAAIRLAIQLSK